MMSVPNQKIVCINKPKYQQNFLQIGVQEWQEARQAMTYSEFSFYLYLASNANGYNLELSQKAVENTIGIKKTSYHDAIKKLTALGYLVQRHGNVWNFFTCPVRQGGGAPQQEKTFGEVPQSGRPIPPKQTTLSENSESIYRPANREIDRINNINSIDNSSFPLSFEDYCRDMREEETREYLSSLSDGRKGDFIKACTQLARAGKSSRWIWEAVKGKTVDEWETWGFGLLFKTGYTKPIDDFIAEQEAYSKKVCEDIERQIEAREKRETLTIRKNRKKDSKRWKSRLDEIADISEE